MTRILSMALTLALMLAGAGPRRRPQARRQDPRPQAPRGGLDPDRRDDRALDQARRRRHPPNGDRGAGVVTVGRGNIRTREKFGDFRMHLEFNIPYMPEAKGQARGNSGVYLQGIYELQVLDSYGLKPQSNDCGAIYQQIIPAVNACKPPLRWQTYDITFHAARREGDKVTRKARLTVVQNEPDHHRRQGDFPVTRRGPGVKEGEFGPIMLQDHGNAVQYRNTWIAPLAP